MIVFIAAIVSVEFSSKSELSSRFFGRLKFSARFESAEASRPRAFRSRAEIQKPLSSLLMGRGLPQPYPALETHPGRGSAFFIVLGNFCAFSCVFLCFGRLLHVFACFCIFFCSWGALGRSWSAPGRSWDALGALLGRSWALLGALGALLGRSWSDLGRSWGALGALLGKNTKKSRGGSEI